MGLALDVQINCATKTKNFIIPKIKDNNIILVVTLICTRSTKNNNIALSNSKP